MTEHQTPGWQLPQQLPRDEPPEEQDVIAASEEVTLQQQQLLPRGEKEPAPAHQGTPAALADGSVLPRHQPGAAVSIPNPSPGA